MSSRWVLAGVLGLFAGYCVFVNLVTVGLMIFRGENGSFCFFFGGIFGAFAVLACPLQGSNIWFWVPALVDPGSAFALIAILVDLARKKSE